MSEFALERTREGSTAAERQMAWISHDVMDRVWDELGPADRNDRQRFFAWLILNPQHLKEWAGVDVLGGWIKGANRNHEWWERCAPLVSEYAKMRRYVEVVVARNSNLSVSESDVFEE